MSNEQLVQIGMRAAIRDIQDYVIDNTNHPDDVLRSDHLRSYLVAMLVTSGVYDDVTDATPDDPDSLSTYISSLRVKANVFGQSRDNGEG